MSFRKLRVCQIVEATSAGVARHVMDLIEGLQEEGLAQVDLIWSPLRADERFIEWIERAGVENLSLPMRHRPGLHDVRTVRAIRRYLRQHGPFDVIHGHSSKGGALARLASPRLGAKVFYTPHALAAMNPTLPMLPRMMFAGIERVLSRLTHRLIAVSPEEADFARGLGIPPSTIATIPNGITPCRPLGRSAARHRLGVAPEQVVVGFVGRLVAQKHPELLIEAFADVATQFSQARLMVVGDGPLMSTLRRLAGRLGAVDRIRFLGATDGRAVMPAFDVLVLCSRYEGLPYVALEAMVERLPLVVTATAGCGVLVEPERTGLVVPAGCAKSLADALRRLIADPQLRERMGRNAQARVREFSVERMVQNTMSEYCRMTQAGQEADGRSASRLPGSCGRPTVGPEDHGLHPIELS